MKYRILLIVSFVIVFTMVFTLSGCASGVLNSVESTPKAESTTLPSSGDEMSDTESTPKAESTTSPSDGNGTSDPSPDPEAIIYIHSEQEYNEVKDLLLLSDEELDELYLGKYTGGFPGLTQRERLEDLVEAVEKYAPVLPRIDAQYYQYAALEIYPKIDFFRLVFQDHNGIRYFILYQEKGYVTPGIEGKSPIASGLSLGGYPLDLYFFEYLTYNPSRPKVSYWRGCFELEEYTVEVIVDPPESKDALILSSFYFVSEADTPFEESKE